MSRLSVIAGRVQSGEQSAVSSVQEAIATLKQRDARIGAVTKLLEAEALADAAALDARIASGEIIGPLAGVPFGVKDLFDVKGIPTTAGAAMRRNESPASTDAEAVARLKAAGAILVATLNMDEYAYGFVTVNDCWGTTKNPHDVTRLSGGSSGGSAAAVADGMLPLTLGSDTNGSIRVPSALCGVYGLKPAHGTLPMEGVFPFVDSFDDIGPFTTSLADLTLAWQVLLGSDPAAGSPPDSPRIARLGGWFGRNMEPALEEAIAGICRQFGNAPTVELPHVAIARSAAFLMTAAEGGERHLAALRTRALEFDPATRDRLIAGALLPASTYFKAERFRDWFRAEADKLFAQYDVLLAPSVGCVSPLIDEPVMPVDGAMVPARANLGLYTQPLSFIGLPVLAVPLKRPGQLPLGLQLVGAPGREGALIAFARQLEEAGIIGYSAPAAA
jgi:AtzE family amidohydrolase